MADTFRKVMLDGEAHAHLNLRAAVPTGRIRAVVHINHGMAEHCARYRRFAVALVEAGFAAYAHDHRGHGETTAPGVGRGQFGPGGFRAVLHDVAAVNDHIRGVHQGVPVVAFGHSMGSIIALNFALAYPDHVDGLACWNAGVETGLLTAASRLILGTEALLRGRAAPSKIARSLTFDTWNRQFKPNRTAFDWLSRDEAEVDAYVADPMCGFDVSVGLWQDLIGAIYHAADDRKLAVLPKDFPVHVLGGGADPCSNRGRDMERLAARLEKAGMTDVTRAILPETRHESLNEINRDQTTAAFIDWLTARF
jgi:alpha-beta hydrolase superfamily lysophospholipase